MKLLKKFSKGIIAVVLCLLLATAALAAATVTYTATLGDDVLLCTSELEKTVTLTVKADQKVEMDAFTAQVKVPEGLELIDITNEALVFGEENFLLENGMIMWYSVKAENVTNDLLAEISIKVPEGTAAGEYEIVFDLIDISRDWGMPWEDEQTITATLKIVGHADGDDADHKCDACDGTVDGAECAYEVEYEWADDYSTCTATGTCACGETDTAEASVTSEVTAGNCQTEKITTYTATFTESWVTNKTVTKEVKGEKDPSVHAGTEVTYTDNEDGTHSATYDCCDEVYVDNEDHIYVDGKCVCGAEGPEAPSDPEIPDGLKGDVNLDGEVTTEDAVALLQHALQASIITDPEALANGEVTNDGELTMEDAVKILQYALKAIDSWD